MINSNATGVFNYLLYVHHSVLFRFFVPCISLTGVIGNLLSLLSYLSNAKLRQKFVTPYFCLLGVSNLCLCVARLRTWVRSYETLNLPGYDSELSCKLTNYFEYVCSITGVLCIFTVTTLRFIRIIWPHNCLTVYYHSRASHTVIITVIIGTPPIVLSFLLFGLTLDEDGNCRYLDSFKTLALVSTVVVVVSFVALPTLALLIINLLMMRILAKRKEIYGRFARRKFITNVTLVTISLCFALCTTPLAIVNVFYLWAQFTENPQLYQSSYTLLYYGEFIFSLQATLNFFLYSVTSRDFRAACRQVITCQICKCTAGRSPDKKRVQTEFQQKSVPKYRKKRIVHTVSTLDGRICCYYHV